MGGRFRWLMGFLLVAALAGVAFYSYNLGVSHGLVQGIAERAPAAAAPGATAVPIVIWPRPWGYGFGFFPFFPLLFILFWFFVLRGLFWRRAWYGGGFACGGRRVPPAFDEWHKRAHAQTPTPQTPVNL